METVDKVYMAASGAPERNKTHAVDVADLALSMMQNVKKIQGPHGMPVEIRIGETSNYI